MKRQMREIRYALGDRSVRGGLWALLASAVVAVVATAYWWPAASEHEQLLERIANQRREVVRNQQAAELLHAYQQAQSVVPSLEAKLAQAPSQGQLVEQLGGLVRRHGVRVLSEAYEESKRADRPPALIAELVVVGSYAALRNVIDGLASLPSWSEVEELRIEQTPAGELRGRLRIVTHRQATSVASRGKS
jgi:Tfp pilus assembly protein PilO